MASDGGVGTMRDTKCAICGESITRETEAHWDGWVDEYGDQLAYVPILHDHRPAGYHEPVK
jgi:hypothetical protein